MATNKEKKEKKEEIMAFRSKAQFERLKRMVEEGKFSKTKFEEWLSETPDIEKLPLRIHPQKEKTSGY